MIDRRTCLTSGVAAAAGLLTLPAAAQSATAGGVEGYRYRLPSFKRGSRLVFIGDSITDMKWGRKESDRNHYLGHSYVYLIMARLGVDLAAAELDVYNRGISGHKVSDLRKRWQKDAVDMKPDLLSVLVGINDIGRGVKPEDYERDYRFILGESRAAKPDLRLVLLDPFGLQSGRMKGESAWAKRRADIEAFAAIVKKLAGEFDALHIETQAIFDAALQVGPAENWIWDGVHPLPQGHELIARHWIEAAARRWKT